MYIRWYNRKQKTLTNISNDENLKDLIIILLIVCVSSRVSLGYDDVVVDLYNQDVT